ncbi:MAG: hypothetical protein AB7U45_06345 [Desulfamplus sp.]
MEVSAQAVKAVDFLNVHLENSRQNGAKDMSVGYYLDLKEYDKAADMIKQSAVELIVKGEFTTLKQWIDRLPDSIVQNDPWLICYLAIAWRVNGGIRNVENLLRSLSMFQEQKNIRGAMLATAYLIEAAVFVREPADKIGEWISQGEEILSDLSFSPLFSWTRSVLWQYISFGYIAGDVDIQKGISACQNARLLAKKIDNREIEFNSSIIMAFGYVKAGNCYEAEKELKRLSSSTYKNIHPEYHALKILIKIDVELKKGNFELVEQYLLESGTDIEKFGLSFLYPNFIELNSMYSIYTEQFGDAGHLAEHLSDFSILTGNNFYLALSLHIKAILNYHTASITYKQKSDAHKKRAALESAEKCSKEAIDIFNQKKSEIHLYMGKLLHAVILIQIKEFEIANSELNLSVTYFTKSSSGIAWCEAHAALGLLFWEQKKTEQAKEHILRALTRVVHEGYRRFLLLSSPDFVKAVILGICFDTSELICTNLLPLLETQFASCTSDQLTHLISNSVITANSYWKSTLKRLYVQLLPKITIKTLGGFSVMIDNKQLNETSWEGSRPKLLLKVIICNNSSEISREKLIEDMWPECSDGVGEKNFKINLHRLRNTLESGVDKKMGYCYLKLNAGRISLNPQLVSVDIDTFSHLLELGYSHLKHNRIEKALSFFEKAVALYKGDFLPEESLLPLINSKRDSLKRDFIDLIMTITNIYKKMQQTLHADRYLRIARLITANIPVTYE